MEHRNSNFTYVEFPEKFTYNSKEKKWNERKNVSDTFGRINKVHPIAGEVYYLRMLLHHDHSRGKETFETMMAVNDISYESYQVLGLLQDGKEWDEALSEGSLTKSLRELFIMIVIFCPPASPKDLFDRHYIEWVDDFLGNTSKKGVNLSLKL